MVVLVTSCVMSSNTSTPNTIIVVSALIMALLSMKDGLNSGQETAWEDLQLTTVLRAMWHQPWTASGNDAEALMEEW